MNNKGQLGFIMVVVGLLLLFLGVVVYSILTPVMAEFIEVGKNSSVEHDDEATNFFITLIPIWIILLLLASAVWIIASGGGGL